MIILYQKVLVIALSVNEEVVVLYTVCCVMYSVWYLFLFFCCLVSSEEATTVSQRVSQHSLSYPYPQSLTL